MSQSFIRQSIAYLLIVLLPLQAAAASGMALCADMGVVSSTKSAESTESTESTESAEHCADMASMPSPSSTDHSSTSHHNSGCWLGSTCLAGLVLLAVPAAYAGVNIERTTPVYLPQTSLYLSYISDSPLRPPTTL